MTLRVWKGSCWGALLMLGAVWVATPSARAQGGGKAPSNVNAASVSERLKSANESVVEKALVEAKSAGKGAAPLAPAIEELLRRGTRPNLAALALSILAEAGSPATAPSVKPYLHHRSPELRRKAVTTIIKIGGPETLGWLRDALSDPDPGVRGIAASGIGTRKGHEALGDLFRALDHQVNEAAASIGQLCQAGECEKFIGKTGAIGLDVMTSGFDQILFRPTTEVSDDLKIKVVERVRELGTQEANKYLRDLASRWPPGSSPRVKLSIDQAVIATAGSRS